MQRSVTGASSLEAIATLGASASTSGVTAAVSDAEGRQLTVMSRDLVGTTALSTRFDPEDLRRLIAHYHRVDPTEQDRLAPEDFPQF